MAKREISIVLRAKNDIAAGLKKAQATLSSFGGAVVSVGKKMATAFAGATAALAATMVKAQAYNKQIGQIRTVSTLSFNEASAGVRKLSAEFGLAKEELTKGLYDALSAGIPQENVFDFMATASKTAVAGATTTKEAVDFLTTAINAFKIPAGEADKVADTLFQTVKLGKTTVGELAASFAQVGPLAAASGVAFEEVMAAAATLTKQGTPTAQAMTQIRAAITAMNDTLGDGWSSTMTLQEGMAEMARRAGGSQTALKELTGRVEGMNAILGITGANAQMAADDLASVAGAAGAAAEAFGKMGDTNPIDKAVQAFNNLILVIGDNAIRTLAPYIDGWAVSLASFAEKLDAWAQGGGMISLVAQVQAFGAEFVYRLDLIGNAVKITAGFFRDVWGPPIEYVSSLIAAFVGKAQTDLRALGEGISYIASTIRRPWEFSLSEMTDLFKRHAANTLDANRQLISALKGDDVELTSHRKDAIAERESIQKKHADRINQISQQQLAALAALDQKTVKNTQQAVQQIVQVKQEGTLKVVEASKNEAKEVDAITQDLLTERIDKEEKAAEKIVQINKNLANEKVSAEKKATSEIINEQQKKIIEAYANSQRIIEIDQNTGRALVKTSNYVYYTTVENLLKKIEKENEFSEKLKNINSSTKDAVSNIWRAGVDDFKNAEDQKLSIAQQTAAQIQSINNRTMANTGFNVGLTGRTFETGGMGGADYQQAIANLRARGFQIGGMAGATTQRIAGVGDIVRELQRIREQNDSLLRMS